MKKNKVSNKAETLITDDGTVEKKDTLGYIATILCIMVIGGLILLGTLAIIYS